MKTRHMLRLLFVLGAFALCALALTQKFVAVRADLHAHTAYSDAKDVKDRAVATPATALDAAIGRSVLNVMAVTDHGEWLTPEKWQLTLDHVRTRQTAQFVALRGFEWTDTVDWGMWPTGTAGLPFDDTGSGHINVFGTTEYTGVEAYTGAQLAHATGRNIISFYDWLANRSEPLVVAQFNHPSLYAGSTHFDNFEIPRPGTDWAQKLIERVALIEVTCHKPGMFGTINTEGIGSGDDLTIGNIAWYIKALQKGWRVAPVASSDTHLGGYGEKAQTSIFIPIGTELSEQVVLEALRARRTSASENGGKLRFAAGNQTTKKMMGSQLSNAPTHIDLHYDYNSSGIQTRGKVKCQIVWVCADYTKTTDLGWVDLTEKESNEFSVSAPSDALCCFAIANPHNGTTISAPVWFPTVSPPKQAPVKSAPVPTEFVADFQLLKKAISVLRKHRTEVLKVMGEPAEAKQGGKAFRGFPQDPLRWIYGLKASLGPDRIRTAQAYCVLEFDDEDRLFSIRFSYEFSSQFILGYTLINDVQAYKEYRGTYPFRLAPRLADIAPYLMSDIPLRSPTAVMIFSKDERTGAAARFITSSGVTVDAFGVYTTYPIVHSRKFNAQTGLYDETDTWNTQVGYADLRTSTIKIYAARPETKLENWYLTTPWQKVFDPGVGYPKPIYIRP